MYRRLLLSFALLACARSGATQSPTIPLESRTLHVAVRDELAFLSVTAGLRIVDVSKPETPRDVATVVLPQSAMATVYAGEVVFVAQGPSGVYAIDISDAADPQVIAHMQTPGSAMMLDLNDHTLAVADGSAGIVLYDMRDLENPVLSDIDKWLGYVRSVRFRDGDLFACAGRAGLVRMRSNAARAEVTGQVATAGDARDVAFAGDIAFVADGRFGVTIVDISGDGDPQRIATIATADVARGVAYADHYLYVADGQHGVARFAVKRGTALEPLDALPTADGYADKVTISGRHLYVANDFAGLFIYDIRRPQRPKAITR